MKPPTIAVAYATLYPVMAEAAREKGYALALHGTMARDLDVIAVPWTDEAATADDVVQHVADSIHAYICGGRTRTNLTPTVKPHGRLAWTLQLEVGSVDISVMPRIDATTTGPVSNQQPEPPTAPTYEQIDAAWRSRPHLN